MVDTPQTSNNLLTTVFQDGQADGSITANDIRDLIVSLKASHGTVKLISNATVTTITVSGTYYPVTGTFVAGGSPSDITEGTDGKLTYTGASDRHFHIVSNLLQWTSEGGSNVTLPCKSTGGKG